MKKAMMEFLKELSETPLPVWVYQTELIDQVRSYVSAGLVIASLSSNFRAHSSTQAAAHVLKITIEGRRVLKKCLKRPG
jgi:hypothetical protein